MKEEYRAIVARIEYQNPNGHYGVSSQRDSFDKRVPVDLDHPRLEHRLHSRLIESHEGENMLY